jgi:hypothetical protein
MPVILDPNDCGPVASITMLFYPTAGSATPVPADTCTLRRFVAYMRRPDWDILLREDLGDHLGPPLATFTDQKEGSLTLEPDIGGIVVYYTGRDATTGPFQLQRECVSIADVWPVDLVGCLRVRNIANALVKHFPDLARDLGPYTK